MKFCVTCVSLLVQQWSQGITHVVPDFGDAAQRYTAKNLRVETVCDLLRAKDFEALKRFEEFQAVSAELKLRPMKGFREVMDQIPVELRRTGFGSSGKARRQYRKHMQRWKSGGALRKFKEMLYSQLTRIVDETEHRRYWEAKATADQAQSRLAVAA